MEDSKIEWTDHTFNPWIGCRKVSAGCQNCYAETLSKRFGKTNWNDRVLTSEENWKKPLTWDKKAQKEGIRRKVFCASMADVFDEDVPDEWRNRLLNLIYRTPNLDWLLLTKRQEKALEYFSNICNLPDSSYMGTQLFGYELLDSDKKQTNLKRVFSHFSNIWIGTTVENQAMADKRIPILLQIPASRRFLSCEPLLEELPSLSNIVASNILNNKESYGIDWVICGGESGHKARPINPDWVRSLRDQCTKANVPFFFKQWGEWGEVPCYTDSMKNLVKFETDGLPTFMKKVGRKNAGRLLDGREWNEVPL